MEREHHIAFGPFRPDVTHGRLRRGEQVIVLRPRTLAMLSYLVAHPGRLMCRWSAMTFKAHEVCCESASVHF